MKHFLRTPLLLLVATVTANCLFADPTIIVNSDNGNSTSEDELTDYLIGKRKFWESGEEVVIAVLKSNAEAETALESLTKMNQSRFKSHWQRLAFSGRGTMPKQFNDAQAVIAFVSANKGAIGILDSSGDQSTVKKAN